MGLGSKAAHKMETRYNQNSPWKSLRKVSWWSPPHSLLKSWTQSSFFHYWVGLWFIWAADELLVRRAMLYEKYMSLNPRYTCGASKCSHSEKWGNKGQLWEQQIWAPCLWLTGNTDPSAECLQSFLLKHGLSQWPPLHCSWASIAG